PVGLAIEPHVRNAHARQRPSVLELGRREVVRGPQDHAPDPVRVGDLPEGLAVPERSRTRATDGDAEDQLRLLDLDRAALDPIRRRVAAHLAEDAVAPRWE